MNRYIMYAGIAALIFFVSIPIIGLVADHFLTSKTMYTHSVVQHPAPVKTATV